MLLIMVEGLLESSSVCNHTSQSRVCLQTELDDAMSCYQLIITITISHNSKSSFEEELLIVIVKYHNLNYGLQNCC